MNFTIYHEAKSKYAYLYDKDTVHLRLITSKNDVKKIEVIYGDPFFWGPQEKDPDKWEWKIETSDNVLMKKEYVTEIYDHFFIALQPTYKRMKYAFIVDDRWFFGCRGLIDLQTAPSEKRNLFNYFNFPFLNEEDLFNAPSWVQDQTWYSIFPERFHNGDPSTNPEGTLPWGKTDKYSNAQRFGGDLKGIIEKLDYIKDMGFTGIYMTPIFDSDSSHKYDVKDYYKIDPAFGTNDDLKDLVEEAHKRGLKVMLDAVFNHCAFRHPFFQDVIQKGKDSIYYDAFYIIDDSKPVVNFPVLENGMYDKGAIKQMHHNPDLLNFRTFAFTPAMPKVKASHRLWKEHLLGAATYWINEYGIDGWRLDVSNEVSHAFWRDFRIAVKDAKSDAYIIGENWDNSNPWLQGDQYDAVMNYEILFPIWNYFGTNIDHHQYTSTEFMYKINKVLTDYPKNVLQSMYNLVDSHDTTRILEICNNDIELALLPYLFMFTFPGAPSVYYGGEVGLSGKHDPDNRRCMIWDKKEQNKTMQNHIKKLIKLRNKYDAFKSPDYEWLEVNDEHEFVIFKKQDLYFILSKRYNPTTIILPKELQHRTLTDVYSKQKITVETTLAIGKYGFYILK